MDNGYFEVGDTVCIITNISRWSREVDNYIKLYEGDVAVIIESETPEFNPKIRLFTGEQCYIQSYCISLIKKGNSNEL